MEFKGTKGHWAYRATQLENWKPTVFRIFEIDKQGFYDSGICPINNDTEESEYNALLISKAPEMLEKVLKINHHHKFNGHLINEQIEQLLNELKPN